MTFQYPLVLVFAVVVIAGLAVAYGWLQRQRSRALAAAGLTPAQPRRGGLRRNLPPVLFLVALALLLVGVARPQATVPVPRAAGTVPTANSCPYRSCRLIPAPAR